MSDVKLYLGDCLDVMAEMGADSVDSIVTDPPYELGFMGKHWDSTGIAYNVDVWAECLRVAKPGAHLLAFGGTRTHHRLMCAIEDAGWEIRDTVMWVYGSGFPKSLDVSKAIDKAAGAERTEMEWRDRYHDGATRQAQAVGSARISFGCAANGNEVTLPATPAAKQWQGWGTALKPAWEPVIVARKPLIGTVAANVLEYGTGAINIDGCRVEYVNEAPPDLEHWRKTSGGCFNRSTAGVVPNDNSKGRWPANLIHDGSDEVTGLFPQGKAGTAVRHNSGGNTFGGNNAKPPMDDMGYGDSDSAARFFYCAKASKADRDEGLDTWGAGIGHASGEDVQRRNNHPTVKPTALMRYHVRIVTPPDGIVLDPFAGSGSTGKAAVLEGFSFVGIEIDAEYLEIARRRIEHAQMQPPLEGLL